MSIAKTEVRNWIESVHLKIYGYFERGEKTFVECEIHGIVEAYTHGWKERLECPTCFKKRFE